jgi:TonB-linked SusC/RagA family outer membrane protein
MEKKCTCFWFGKPNLDFHRLIMTMIISCILFFCGIWNIKAVPSFSLSAESSVNFKNSTYENLPEFSSGTEQQKQISGKVTDEKGNPLTGVTVLVKGTTLGTLTDASGKYIISNVPQDATLVFSFIGMTTQEIPSGVRGMIDIVLKEASFGLDEVVVVGYGTQKKVTLTGSISSVSDKELKAVTTSSLTDNLAGKIPGLRVRQNSSEPGAYNSSFDIRGWGSALIIVDGIPSDNFVKIDPNEIDNITILKDASAAIYGVRAANGVILITTKKGVAGESKITYSGTYGMQSETSYPRAMNAAEFLQVTDWAQQNSNIPPAYSQQQIDDYKSGKTPSTNWRDVVMNKSAPQQQHNLSMSGGNEKIKYFGSLGYFNQAGLWKSGDLNYNRYNFRLNVNAQITKNLEAELQIGGISDKTMAPSRASENIITHVWRLQPNFHVFANDNPAYLQDQISQEHPIAITNTSYNGYDNYTTNALEGTFALNYKIPFIDGLKARFLYGYNLNHDFDRRFVKKYAVYNYDPLTQTYNPTYNQSPSNMSESYSQGSRSTLQTSLTYEKTINDKHNIKGLVLFENLKTASDGFNGSRQFDVDAVDQLYAGNSVQQITSNDVSEFSNQGIIGRLNYNYSSKYIFEFSFREDGSSRFPKGNRWGFFPAVSVGWRLSEENFIKNNLPFLTNFKLRGSWGQMGDDAASSFQFVPGYLYPTNSRFDDNRYPQSYIFGGSLVNGLGVIGMTNPGITWFKATTMDFGVDGNIFNSNINFQFDIFRRLRTGLLAQRLLSLPQSVGASLPQENLESDLSTGMEFVLGTTQHINKVTFGISGQLTFTQNEWVKSEEALPGNSYLNWTNSNKNRNKDIIWGYKLDGVFQTQDEINLSPIQDGQGNRLIKPGDMKYTDVNGDGIIDGLDKVPLATGNSIPLINYGITLTFSWKGFDMNALFQGATGMYTSLGTQLINPLPWGGLNGLSQFYDCWHQADFNDPNSAWIPGKYPPPRVQGVFNPNFETSFYTVKDASYIRLKSLEIGYTLPEILTKKVGIQQFRIFANGYNILTWSHIPYMDPEHPGSGDGTLYPITKNFNIGVNVTF